MKTTAKIFLKAYKFFISPIFAGLGCRCRFHPTCSQYASDAIEILPMKKALPLVFRRIARCGPWHPGGVDKIVIPAGAGGNPVMERTS